MTLIDPRFLGKTGPDEVKLIDAAARGLALYAGYEPEAVRDLDPGSRLKEEAAALVAAVIDAAKADALRQAGTDAWTTAAVWGAAAAIDQWLCDRADRIDQDQP